MSYELSEDPGSARTSPEAGHVSAALNGTAAFPERRFRDLLGSLAGAIIWEATADTLAFTFVTESAEAVLNYPLESWLSDKDFWVSHLHPDDRDAAISACREAIARGEDHELEYRMVAGDGREVWLHDRVTVVNDTEGRAKYLRGLMIDITERKRAEEELARAERKYRDIFENAVFGVFQTSRKGRFVSANEAMARILGYEHGQELVECISDIASEVHVDAARRSELTRILEEHGELHEFECQLRRRDGRHIWASLSGRLRQDPSGQVLGYEGIVEDITDRKAAQRALIERDRQARELVEGVGVAVYATDADGHITLYNDAAVELWGRRPKRSEDRWCGSLRLYYTDGRPMPHDECPMALTLKQNRPVRGTEAMAERPDGTLVCFIPFPTPLRDASGALIGAINVLVDITDRKRAEAELKRRYAELEALHGLTAAINTAISAEDIHNEAINAVIQSVHPDRAALLLLDPDGVMRFKAWRGLSEEYRTAVTVHSPWAPEASDPQPVLVSNVGDDPSVAALREVIQGEGIGALALIPLCAQRKLIGKFMLYYNSAHAFSPQEVRLAGTVANNLAQALARRQAEDERERLLSVLQAERQRISSVIGDVPGVVWEAYGRPDSAAQRIDFVSEHIEGMTGYKVEDWLGSSNFWLSIVHPEDRERAAAEAAAIYNGRAGGHSEFRWITRGGQTIWVESRSTVILDETGEPIGMRGVTMDITDRKEYEEALRAAEAQLSIVTNAVPALLSYVDAHHRYVYLNRGYEDWFGQDPDTLSGRHMRDVLSQRAYRKIVPHIRQALRGETVRFEDSVSYQGAKRWIHAEYIPHRAGGKVAGFVSLITDISERKAAEEDARRARAETERRLSEEAAINRIAELLRTTLDLDTVCQVALAEAKRVTGTDFGILAVRSGEHARIVSSVETPASALGHFRELSPDNPTALARALYDGRATFSASGRLRADSARFLRESGASRFAVVPLIARGAVVGALQIAGRSGKQWSARDRQFMRRVADHIALAISNAQAYQSIEEAFQRRDEGVRALAHEVRTPLTALKGFSQLALRHMEREPMDREHLKDSMEEIAAASDRLVRVAEQMLSASTVESGITRIRKERVPLGRFLRQAIAEFIADERPCPVRLEPVPRTILYIDSQLIRQVLWNLLANAIRYSPAGEPITVRAVKNSTTATISVIDNGPGVPLGDLARLFEKFQTGSGNDTGLGLGLYLARQVVEAHAGTISYEPGESGGAVFSFALPIRRFRT